MGDGGRRKAKDTGDTRATRDGTAVYTVYAKNKARAR